MRDRCARSVRRRKERDGKWKWWVMGSGGGCVYMRKVLGDQSNKGQGLRNLGTFALCINNPLTPACL